MSADLGATSYSAVSWTAGDVITEAKMDAMVANDQAYDSHASQGILVNNNLSLGGKNSVGSNLNIAKINSSNILEIGDAGLVGVQHNTPYANLTSLSRQALINANFVVNQRVYVSNATLAAGAYGHDRWKAGAGGGDYTFTQLPSSTQITIKTGKSLIQVIEDKNVIGGTYTLSWEGTAQARFGINSATPSGDYAASPITITTQTAGTVMSVEFNAGTLGKVQLNSGSVALPFQARSFDEELRACQRYYEKSYAYETAPGTNVAATAQGVINMLGYAENTTTLSVMSISYQVPKRTNVTPVLYAHDGTANRFTSLGSNRTYGVNGRSNSRFDFYSINFTGLTVGAVYPASILFVADAEL